jgi:hypothetical protein
MNEAGSYEDRVLADKLFDFLEDRRVLYAPRDFEDVSFVVSSVISVREHLTELLEANQPGVLSLLHAASSHSHASFVPARQL